MKDLNYNFIRNAERVTSFNLVPSDFTSTLHKKEIQHLFNKHFFPNFDLSNTTKNVDMQKLNANIQKLKAEDFEKFQKMHTYNLKGVGPGEVTLYFLINDAHLGGGASQGVDLVVGPKKYEVKAVDIGTGNYAKNFKMGGSFDLSDVITGLMDLKKKVSAGGEGVNTAALEAIRRKYPNELDSLIKTFRERAYEKYFKDHEIIFIQNTTRSIGNIAAIKRVKKEEIFLERVTSGVIKPMVKL